MRLEELANPAEMRSFNVTVVEGVSSDRLPFFQIDWRPWVHETRRLQDAGRPADTLAAMFHNALACGTLEIGQRAGLSTVVLAGGCFQNRLLTERVTQRLRENGFRVLSSRRVPPGDGGLAVGQIWAARLRLYSP